MTHAQGGGGGGGVVVGWTPTVEGEGCPEYQTVGVSGRLSDSQKPLTALYFIKFERS